MYKQKGRELTDFMERLESRRLLSFNPFGDTTTIASAAGDPYFTDVAVAQNGNYIAVTKVFQGDSATQGLFTILATRFDQTGRQLGPALTIGSYAGAFTGYALDISVAMDADGDAVVAYALDNGPADAKLYFRTVSRSGDLGSQVLAAEGFVDDPSVSMADDGRIFFAWIQPVDRMVNFRVFDPTGAPLGPGFTAYSDNAASTLTNLDIDARADGSGAVFLFTYDFSIPRVLFGQVSTTASIGSIGVVDGPANNSTNNASIAALDGGRFVVGYEEYDNSSTNPTHTNGYAQRYDSSGDPLGDAIALGVARVNRGVHAIAVDNMSDGGFVAAFQQLIPDFGETVYVRRYSADGVPDGPGPVPMARDTRTLHSYVKTAVGADDNGSAVVLFSGEFTSVPPGGDPVTFRSVQYRRITPQPAALDKSVLYVFGLETDGLIEVKSRALSVAVRRNDDHRYFDATLVDELSVQGFDGHDYIANNTALPSTMDGGAGNDTIIGGSARDRITGYAGNDRLYGQGGDDLLYGQDGNDLLFGGQGNDSLNGGAGADFLRGELGSDFLSAVDGTVDQLFGHDGKDSAMADEQDVIRTVETILR